MAEQVCGVCGQSKGAHAGMAHKFSVEGRLEVVEEPKPKAPPAKVDFALRLLLIQKGIITAEELQGMEEAVHATRGNPPQREDPS
jgi:hypothetical protein